MKKGIITVSVIAVLVSQVTLFTPVVKWFLGQQKDKALSTIDTNKYKDETLQINDYAKIAHFYKEHALHNKDVKDLYFEDQKLVTPFVGQVTPKDVINVLNNRYQKEFIFDKIIKEDKDKSICVVKENGVDYLVEYYHKNDTLIVLDNYVSYAYGDQKKETVGEVFKGFTNGQFRVVNDYDKYLFNKITKHEAKTFNEYFKSINCGGIYTIYVNDTNFDSKKAEEFIKKYVNDDSLYIFKFVVLKDATVFNLNLTNKGIHQIEKYNGDHIKESFIRISNFGKITSPNIVQLLLSFYNYAFKI